jgi:hypothetical protein
VRRCVLTGAYPVRIATTILIWCWLNLSRSSGVFLTRSAYKNLAMFVSWYIPQNTVMLIHKPGPDCLSHQTPRYPESRLRAS